MLMRLWWILLANCRVCLWLTLEAQNPFSLFGDIKVCVNILFAASYINTKSPNLTHSSASLPFFPPPSLPAGTLKTWLSPRLLRYDVGVTYFIAVNVNNYLCELDLPTHPPPSSVFLSLSLPRLLIFLPHCPHTPPGVGQPTNRKKQLHHPRQCHNTH